MSATDYLFVNDSSNLWRWARSSLRNQHLNTATSPAMTRQRKSITNWLHRIKQRITISPHHPANTRQAAKVWQLLLHTICLQPFEDSIQHQQPRQYSEVPPKRMYLILTSGLRVVDNPWKKFNSGKLTAANAVHAAMLAALCNKDARSHYEQQPATD